MKKKPKRAPKPAPRKRLTRATVVIFDKPWTVRVLSHAAFERIVKDAGIEGSILAMCQTPPARQLIFRVGHVTEPTVRHELMHAYINSCPYFNQGIGERDTYEEMVCDIQAEYGPDICQLSRLIVKAFK